MWSWFHQEWQLTTTWLEYKVGSLQIFWVCIYMSSGTYHWCLQAWSCFAFCSQPVDVISGILVSLTKVTSVPSLPSMQRLGRHLSSPWGSSGHSYELVYQIWALRCENNPQHRANWFLKIQWEIHFLTFLNSDQNAPWFMRFKKSKKKNYNKFSSHIFSLCDLVSNLVNLLVFEKNVM